MHPSRGNDHLGHVPVIGLLYSRESVFCYQNKPDKVLFGATPLQIVFLGWYVPTSLTHQVDDPSKIRITQG